MYGGGRVGEAAQLIASNPDYPMTVMTPGSNLDDALRAIEAIQLMDIHKQLILGGYPPFIGALIRAGQEAGIDWPSLDVKFTLGGDGFTEEWRDAIYEAIEVDLESDRNAARIVSGYGATDLGTGGGNSPLSILARRMAYEDPEIREALWGDVPFIPSICHTNPNFVVWADNEGQLVVNTLTITPQPNYLIGDLGTVHSYREIIQILGGQPTFKESKAEVERRLKEWGFSLSEVPATSLVSILGRASEGRLGTSFDGAVISGRTIETALIEVGVPFSDFYATVEGDPEDELSLRFTVHVELTPGTDYTDENIERLREEVVDQTLDLLLQCNEDFATSYADNPENACPRVMIHKYNQHPSFRERKSNPKNGRLM
jgi:phenylacetate-coenzyme A ligase PaaK-like adenylate-forming protein